MPPRTRTLLGHGVALALVLLALLPLLGDGLFSADEGALLAQLEQLDTTGEWHLPNPAPDLDPGLEALPMELAYRSPGTGEAGAWAPFTKHAVHVALLWGPFALGGVAGVQAVGIAGTVAAAVAAGVLASRLDLRTGPWALWATGLATPLLFDSFLAMGHTLGAGLAGLAAVAAVRAVDGAEQRRAPPPVAVLAAAALAGACVLIRSEGAFVGPALAAGVLVAGGRRSVVTAVALLLAAPAGYLLNEAVDASVWPDPVATVSAGDRAEYGFIDGRVEGFVATWLDPADDRDGPAVAGFLAAVAVWAAVIAHRRIPAVPIAIIGAAAVVLAVVRTVGNTTAIPGLLVACPLLAGLAGLGHVRRWDAPARLLCVGSGVFAAAVLATQYPEGGTGEWGGRYFALALPWVVPLAVVGLAGLATGRRGPRDAGRVAVGAVAAVSAVLAFEAVSTLDRSQERASEVVDLLVDLRSEVSVGRPEPVPVVTSSGAIARFAWEHVDEGAWHTTTRARLGPLASDLAVAGHDTLILFTQSPEADLAVLDPSWDAEPVPQSALLYVLRR